MSNVINFKDRVRAAIGKNPKIKSTSPFKAEPFIKFPVAVLMMDLSATALKVYLVLMHRWYKNANFSNRGVTRVSRAQLADECGFSTKQIRTAIADLERVGLVKKEVAGTQKMALRACSLPETEAAMATHLHRFMPDDASAASSEDDTDDEAAESTG